MSFARKEPRENLTAALAFPRPTRKQKPPKRLRARQPEPGEAPKFSTLARGKRMKRNWKTKQQVRESVFAPYERWLTSDGAFCAVCGTSQNIQGAHVGVGGMGMRNGTAADKIRMCGQRLGDVGCHARFDQTMRPWTKASKAVFSRHQRLAHWAAFRAWAGVGLKRLAAMVLDGDRPDEAGMIAHELIACDEAIAARIDELRAGGR